jgi:NADH-quinone oxidoreductase subunit C
LDRDSLIVKVSELLDGVPVDVGVQHDAAVVACAVGDLVEVLRRLKQGPPAFDYFSFMTAVDYPPTEATDDQPAEPGRLELVYHVAAVFENAKVFVACEVPRPEERRAPPRAPSVSGLYPGANWHEREAFDMFGVEFEGHPDLRRILCPDDWVGHPLLKDYDPALNDPPYTPEKCWPEVADKR